MITDYGTISLAACIPGAVTLQSAGLTGIALALPNLQAQIAALQAFIPLPINFATSLALANSIVDGVTLAIAGGLPAPDISAQIAIVQAILVVLTQALQAIETQFNILNSFSGYLSTGGIQALGYTGNANAMGGEISGVVVDAAPSAALVLIARSPEAITALQAMTIL